MILTIAVEPGTTLTPDSQGRYVITPAVLEALGAPTATLSLPNNMLIYMDVVVTDEATNVIKVSLQLRNALGEALALRAVVECWLSDTENGAPSAVAFSGAGLSVSSGTLVHSIANDLHFKLMTTSAGSAVMTFTETGARTSYFNLVINNIHQSGDQAMVWGA